ncbi:MAG TPA: site-specific DNA-methyltransferase, partial [bacterium]|nr:site-specific DNA-methyltransferase [bacterium]
VPSCELPKKYDDILWYTKSSFSWTFNPIYRPYSEGTTNRGRTAVKGENAKLRSEGTPINNWWTDVKKITSPTDYEKLDYPTQKSEELLSRIISLCSNKGDIVLDFFGGSGTTMAVAEKLERRWITCDIGKLSYFTMQKRILQINSSKSLDDFEKKYGKNAKSFMTCSLGLYDLKKAFDLEWDRYVEFVSRLFEVELNKHKISGFSFDGVKGVYHVKIWDYRSHKDSNVDESYLENIHEVLSGKVKGRVYIIAPVNNFDFLSDYHEIGDTRYYFLKIPYQIIKDLHKIPFQKLRQPQSKKNINDLDETIGFHFIKAPEVKSEVKKIKSQIRITVKEFFSHYRTDDSGNVLGNFEALSAVFIDRNYNGSQFVMTDHFFADDLLPKKKVRAKEDDEDDEASDIRLKLKDIQSKGLNILFDSKGVGKNIMVVYTDIFGNDFSEILKV